MGNLKRGRMSKEEQAIILNSTTNGTSIEDLSKVLNRSEKSIQDILNKNNNPKINKVEVKSVPDAPEDQPKGYARKLFEVQEKNGKRSGISVMTEASSEAGDEFLKNSSDDSIMKSSKYQNCITKAQ